MVSLPCSLSSRAISVFQLMDSILLSLPLLLLSISVFLCNFFHFSIEVLCQSAFSYLLLFLLTIYILLLLCLSYPLWLATVYEIMVCVHTHRNAVTGLNPRRQLFSAIVPLVKTFFLRSGNDEASSTLTIS